jgi:16S rRNA (cytosine1402-N4)-methyltransferase
MTRQPHISVLYQESLEALQPHAGGLYIDGTVGAGGHTRGLLVASSPDGRVLAFDRDADALTLARERLGALADRVVLRHASYAEMGAIAPPLGFGQVDGVLLDLGVSSMQVDTPERGFSFRYDAPLDMRFDAHQSTTAADLVNNLPEAALADLLWRYGEVRNSRKVARAIVHNRPITTTTQLADLAAKISGVRRRRRHPATQLFQALRIAVNDELQALEDGLNAAIALLKPGGRVAVISFHSLEDRYVKNLFRDLQRDCICPPQQIICTCNWEPVLRLVSRKAIKPTDDEIAANPRSRSARLRVAEKR